MVNLTRELSAEFGVPVIEGVCAATRWIETLAALELRTSKRGGYAPPRAKRYKGGFSRYAPKG